MNKKIIFTITEDQDSGKMQIDTENMPNSATWKVGMLERAKLMVWDEVKEQERKEKENRRIGFT